MRATARYRSLSRIGHQRRGTQSARDSMSVATAYYQARVDIWCQILGGVYQMDNATLKLTGRFLLSAGMLALVYTGEVSGLIGVSCATLTSGIDIAAFFEALKETQTDNQTRFRE